MLFEPLMIQGLQEIHDQHRDMGLDVDNMSYEVKSNVISSQMLIKFILPLPLSWVNMNMQFPFLQKLLELEERVGDVSTGLKEETIMKFLKQNKKEIPTGTESVNELEPCCICQVRALSFAAFKSSTNLLYFRDFELVANICGFIVT